MPPDRYSMIPRRVKQYTASPVSLASLGHTCSLSHLSRGMSSARERRKVMAVWVWAFLKPGISRSPFRSICR